MHSQRYQSTFGILLTTCFLTTAGAHAQTSNYCNAAGTYNTVSVGSYNVQTNFWNTGCSGTQCVTINDSTGAFGVTEYTGNCPSVGSYPAIYYGCHYGDCSPGSNLPMLVSAVTCVTSSWDFTPTTTGLYDIAYDIWFSTTTNTSGGYGGGAELMIWLNTTGTPGPAGTLQASNVTIDGLTFNVWEGNIGWNYIAFDITSNVTSVSNLNILNFINYCITQGYINSSWYLAAIEAGIELRYEGVPFVTNSFSAAVNTGCSTGAAPTPTSTPTNTPTATATKTATASPTFTPTSTPTKTATWTPSGTPTSTATLTATKTPSSTPTSTSTSTVTPTPTSTLSPTATSSATPSPTRTATSTPTPTGANTATLTPTSTPTGTASSTATSTATGTPTLTATSTATPTTTSSPTHTTTATPTPTGANTATQTSTSTPTGTASSTATSTVTSTATSSPTHTTTATSTPTGPNTATHTTTATPTATLTSTKVFTATSTATPPAASTPTALLFPNPVLGTGPVTLQLTLTASASQVTVTLYTTSFRRVNWITLNSLPQGINEISVPLTDKSSVPLANGLYYVVVKTAQNRFLLKLLVLR